MCANGDVSADWVKVNKQWPKQKSIEEATNAGVRTSLVSCVASLPGATAGVLKLEAYGDLYSGTSVTGWSSTGVEADSTLKYRALPPACAQSDCYTPSCNGEGTCRYKRLGSAVRSKLVLTGTSSVEVRMKPCSDSTGSPVVGAVTSLWLYNYTERYCPNLDTCSTIGQGGKAVDCGVEYASQCCPNGNCQCNTNGAGSNDKCAGYFEDNKEIDWELPTTGANNDFLGASVAHAKFTSYTSSKMGNNCGVTSPCFSSIFSELSQKEQSNDWHVYRIEYDGDSSPRTASIFVDGNKVDSLQGSIQFGLGLGFWLGL